MTKPIFINGRFLAQSMTGIQRFSYELCRAMIGQGSEIIVLAPKKIRTEYKLNCRVIQFGYFNGIFWEQIDLALFLLKYKNPLLLNFGSPGPIFYTNRIVTVHDLSFFINPAWFSNAYYLYYRFITPLFVRLSKKVLTVSEFSKNEIIRLIGIPAGKISVIHNAVSPSLSEQKSAITANKEQYILTVASLDPRKNLARLVEAYKSADIDKEIKLVMAGKIDPVFNMKLTDDILANCVGYVEDEKLASLYQNAELFVYPSLYEGFGIPPLEAMSLGCPVILSDIPVFREIFGDAACYVDPLFAKSIRDGIRKVINDESYRKELVSLGRERAALYRWERSAEKLKGIIDSI